MADESVVKLASLLLLTTKLWRHLAHVFFHSRSFFSRITCTVVHAQF